jgi:hypothetical protein
LASLLSSVILSILESGSDFACWYMPLH